MSFKEYEYREIITKAICGKGSKRTDAKHMIDPVHEPTSVLGCWVINHSYEANRLNEEVIEITGSYDVNVWYAYEENSQTDVIDERIYSTEEIPLEERDTHSLNQNADEIIAKVTKQPNCLDCRLSDDEKVIQIAVEKEFLVQLIGETKVNVRVENNIQE